jgi:hypothetical protein
MKTHAKIRRQYRIIAKLTENAHPKHIVKVLTQYLHYEISEENILQENVSYKMRKTEISSGTKHNYHLYVLFKRKDGKRIVHIGAHEDYFDNKIYTGKYIIWHDMLRHESRCTPLIRKNLLSIEEELKNRNLIEGRVNRFFGNEELA